MEKSKLNSFAYKAGYLAATVVVLCVVTAIVGLTVKFLFWLF